MQELLVISGKGGTGKTSITGAFAALARDKVMVDCDVDAADLHLLLNTTVLERWDFYGLGKAVINSELCERCGECVRVCRFDAIQDFQVNPLSCEGCQACVQICPQHAISMEPHLSGQWFISDTRYGPLVHAKLGIAEENSGKLVSKLREVSRNIAEKEGCQLIITDGPPGIGCPVISSLTGVDLVLAVTEPTISGFHDLRRVMELAEHFKVPVVTCINKYDLNMEVSKKIGSYCQQEGVEIVGLVPFDPEVSEAIRNGVPLVESSRGHAAKAVKSLWYKIVTALATNIKSSA